MSSTQRACFSLLALSLAVAGAGACGSDDDLAFGGASSGAPSGRPDDAPDGDDDPTPEDDDEPGNAGTGGKSGASGKGASTSKGGSGGKSGAAGKSGISGAGGGSDEGGAGGSGGPSGKGGGAGSTGKGGSSGKAGSAGKGGSAGKSGAGGKGSGAGTGGANTGGFAGSDEGGAGAEAAGAGGSDEGPAGSGGADVGNGGSDAGAGGTDGGSGGAAGSGTGMGAGGSWWGGAAGAPAEPTLAGTTGKQAVFAKWTGMTATSIAVTATRVVVAFRKENDGKQRIMSFPIGSADPPITLADGATKGATVSANGADDRVLFDRGEADGSFVQTDLGAGAITPQGSSVYDGRFITRAPGSPFCGTSPFQGSGDYAVRCYGEAGEKLFERPGAYFLAGSSSLMHLMLPDATTRLLAPETNQEIDPNVALADKVQAFGFRANRYALVRNCPECAFQFDRLALEWGTVPAGFPTVPLVREGRAPIYGNGTRPEIFPGVGHIVTRVGNAGGFTIHARATGAFLVSVSGIDALTTTDRHVYFARKDELLRIPLD